MDKNSWSAKSLRFISILLMGVTALFTIASGAGTTCVAFNPTGFGESMAPLAPFQWLYILFVFVTVAIGLMAARAVILLVQGRSNAYRYAVIALLLGSLVGVIHMLVSRGLRGKSMPVDAVVYTTLLTLAVFLLLRIPRIWQGVNFSASGSDDDPTNRLAAAFTLLATGLLTLSAPLWAGASHTWGGVNWAAAFLVATSLLGFWQVVVGFWLLVAACPSRRRAPTADLQMRNST